MSRLFVENINTTISITNLSAAMRIRGSHLASQGFIIARNYVLVTLLVSREVRAALKDFDS
jgi:hypothetical protein